MVHDEHQENEYLDLPDDPELAFAILQMRKYNKLTDAWENDNDRGWFHERQYVDILVDFDEVHDLGILTAYRSPPSGDQEFSNFFQDFRRNAEMASRKILMEAARRVKTGAQTIVVLDAAARQAVHALINAIREKLSELALPEAKRESLFNKLNAFSAELDRNRTRTESFLAFAVEVSKTGKTIGENFKPLEQIIDRVFEWIEKAQKLKDALPPWSDRKKIEGPINRLPPPSSPGDDEIPF
ncbi:MAG: hypothetical protein HQ481_18050 [Alphaproteobacteria bacterium]|nr:hypothetical protein [Alphaproteobacteria bacterium]